MEQHEGDSSMGTDPILAAVTGVAFNLGIETYWHAECVRSEEGWNLVVYDQDDDGYLTGGSSARSFPELVDVLQEAAAGAVSNLEIEGLSFVQALELLNSPNFVDVACCLARMAPGGDGVWLNGEQVVEIRRNGAWELGLF